MNDSLFNDLKAILANYVDPKSLVDEMTMESDLVKDLNIDSLDVVEIVVDIENQFGIEVEDKLIEEMNTVGDIVRILSAKID